MYFVTILSNTAFMASDHIGGISILSPESRIYDFQVDLMEQYLIRNGMTGTFNKPEKINEIAQDIFNTLIVGFDDAMKQLSSRSLSDYFLFQYEQFATINEIYSSCLL